MQSRPSQKVSFVQNEKTDTPSAQEKPPRSEKEGTRLNLEAHKLITERRYHEAIPLLRRALENFPEGTRADGYKFALYNLGHSLRRSGRLAESLPYLQKTVEIDSEWDKARQELQIATMRLGNAQPQWTSETNN
jgi:tetratricopeptide (TPR) repeat protein